MTTAPFNPLVDAGLAPPPLPPIGITIPAKLHPPLDVSRIKKEAGVKDLVKALLKAHGWFFWMPGANGFGQQGVHDFLALKAGVFLTIETKFGTSKPTALQCGFAVQIMSEDAFSFCVNERNVDHLAHWLESFELAKQHQMRGQEVPPEHGSRMLNAMSVLTDPFAAKG